MKKRKKHPGMTAKPKEKEALMSEKYDAHLESFRQSAFVKSWDEYKALHERSITDPEGFWAEQADTYLNWDKKWDSVLSYDFYEAHIEWFKNGRLNASANCLDRHMGTIADKVALYWEGDDPAEANAYTY